MVNKLTIGPTLPILEMNLKKKLTVIYSQENIYQLWNLNIFQYLYKALLLKEINIVWKWQRPTSPLYAIIAETLLYFHFLFSKRYM